MEDEARAYDNLNAEVRHIDDEISKNRTQEISQIQEQLFNDIEKKIEKIKTNQSPLESTSTPDAPNIDTAQPTTANTYNNP